MAINKKLEFKKLEIELSETAKALSHPARIAILLELAKRNSCICGEIVDVLPLAQSTVSQHLKELLNAGLIKGTVDGPKSCYCIDWKNFVKASNEFQKFTAEIMQHRAKCDEDCC